MQFDFSKWGPLTVLVVALVAVGAITGGLVVITHPETLSFDSFLSDVSKFVIGLGVLGVGHGLVEAKTAAAPADVEEPGDPDALPNIPVATNVPKDQGDIGHA